MTVFRLATWTFAIVAWSFVGPLAWAQPDNSHPPNAEAPPGSNPAELAASQKPVQEELKLSADEVVQLKKLADEIRGAWKKLEKMPDLSDDERRKQSLELSEANEKKLAAVISPEQLGRLKQINLQVLGAQFGPVGPAFRNPKLVAPLELTDEQKEIIATISRETNELMSGLSGLAKGGNPVDALNQYLKMRDAANKKILAVLTSKQQDKWKEMLGEPFKGEIVQPAEFGGGGQGGGNGN